jgi:hypothetical protein
MCYNLAAAGGNLGGILSGQSGSFGITAFKALKVAFNECGFQFEEDFHLVSERAETEPGARPAYVPRRRHRDRLAERHPDLRVTSGVVILFPA